MKGAGKGKDNLTSALEAFGIDDFPHEEEKPFDVLPGNCETISWFMLLQRRWVYGAMGGIIRLDDSAILAQMQMRGIKKNKRIEILDGLMIMENAALEILNEKSDG